MSVPVRSAHVTGWGSYAPRQVLSNRDLERPVDTSDEWIVTRTGIRERRVAAAHETTASLAAVCGARAIAGAGPDPADPAPHRLELEVFTHNARAIHVYKKLGFQEEGTRHQAFFKEGRFVDALMMGMIFDETGGKP